MEMFMNDVIVQMAASEDGAEADYVELWRENCDDQVINS